MSLVRLVQLFSDWSILWMLVRTPLSYEYQGWQGKWSWRNQKLKWIYSLCNWNILLFYFAFWNSKFPKKCFPFCTRKYYLDIETETTFANLMATSCCLAGPSIVKVELWPASSNWSSLYAWMDGWMDAGENNLFDRLFSSESTLHTSTASNVKFRAKNFFKTWSELNVKNKNK